MYKLLTPDLLKIITEMGYCYCLSRTTNIDSGEADICITLFPVVQEPNLADLPEGYDNYFEISEEPAQLAAGIPETHVMVDISEILLMNPGDLYFTAKSGLHQ